jgi:hypothetical protein
MKFPLVVFVLPYLTAGFGPTSTRVLPASLSPVRSRSLSSPAPLCMSEDVRSNVPAKSDPKFEAFDLPLQYPMKLSRLVYMFGYLRKMVNKHEETFNLDLDEKQKKKKGIVAFDTPALIDTRNSNDKQFPSTKMNNPVTSAAIQEFMEKNKQYIKDTDWDSDPSFVKDGSSKDPCFLTEVFKEFAKKFDADIIEFDDEFADVKIGRTLVYSIIVSRKNKTIYLVFRGTIFGEIKDVLVDLRFFQDHNKAVDKITDREPKVHKGFSDYLLEWNIKDKKPKMEQIISVLKEVYDHKAYSDYKLVVTGHSLGGSLSQLAAFVLAGSKETDFIPKPIEAITYASPVVGDKKFLLAYQDLEKEDKIRHIRVSNDGDLIPGRPITPLTNPYTQTGVNIHLQENEEAEVKYENTNSIISQIFSSGLSLDMHSLFGKSKGRSYYERLYAKDKEGGFINKDLLSKTIEDLYDEFAK